MFVCMITWHVCTIQCLGIGALPSVGCVGYLEMVMATDVTTFSVEAMVRVLCTGGDCHNFPSIHSEHVQ